LSWSIGSAIKQKKPIAKHIHHVYVGLRGRDRHAHCGIIGAWRRRPTTPSADEYIPDKTKGALGQVRNFAYAILILHPMIWCPLAVTDYSQDDVGRTVAIIVGILAGLALFVVFISFLRKTCKPPWPAKRCAIMYKGSRPCLN
jgi:hypothetical protein